VKKHRRKKTFGGAKLPHTPSKKKKKKKKIILHHLFIDFVKWVQRALIRLLSIILVELG